MNIITNRCLGGYIYRDLLHAKYENPFIWTGIPDTYFNLLFSQYKRLNFNNIRTNEYIKNSIKKYDLYIDNCVKVEYSHILFDANAHSPVIRDVNIYIDDPCKYIEDKYKERLVRMHDKPKFIYMDLDFTKIIKLLN